MTKPSNEELLEWANTWAERAEQHRRSADFCDQQVARFMGRISMTDDYQPELTLVTEHDTTAT